jgi:hypothetical protein
MRPAAQVPRPVWLLLAAALAAHLAAQLAWNRPAARPVPSRLHPPPAGLDAASLGEPVALARLAMLYVQGAEGRQPLRMLDYGALRAWLEAIVALDPRGQYPLLAASQVYAAVQDPARTRIMLDFVEREFARDPDRRWPHLAHAALLARHRLHDLALARRYAHAIRTRTSPGLLPAWAMQMEALILTDMNEAPAARALIGAMLANGHVSDPNELRFLERRLRALDEVEARPGKQSNAPMR